MDSNWRDIKTAPRDDEQEAHDRFYWQQGKCCAGCDWWQHLNSVAGECTRNAPVASNERLDMLGISSASFAIGCGHAITRRDHVCGDFKDDFDWSTLPIGYLKTVGAPLPDPPTE